MLFKDNKLEEAIKEYEKGIEFDPKNHSLFSNKSFAYMKLKDYESALKDLEKTISLNPQFVKAHARKGLCYQELKDFDKAT